MLNTGMTQMAQSFRYLTIICLLICQLMYSPIGIHGVIQDETIVYATPFDFKEFSYYEAQTDSTKQWNSAVYAALVRKVSTSGDKWVPDLAVSDPIVTNDRKTFTFELQTDLRFSNGHKLTSSDIEFSFKVAMTQEINKNLHHYAPGYIDNSSITLIDARTIQFTLMKVHESPYNLLNFPIIDEETFSDRYEQCLDGVTIDCHWNDPTGLDVVSAGPFRVSQIDRSIITLKANEFYYNFTGVYADLIIFENIIDINDALLAFEAGLAHILDRYYSSDLSWQFAENLEGIDEHMLNSATQDWRIVKLENFMKNAHSTHDCGGGECQGYTEPSTNTIVVIISSFLIGALIVISIRFLYKLEK